MTTSGGVPLAAPAALATLAARFGGALDPAAHGATVDAVATPEEAANGALAPVLAPRLVEAAVASGAWLLVDAAVAARVPVGRRWVHPHAMLALAELLAALGPREPTTPPEVAPDADVAPSAIVLPGARVASGCVIEPRAIVYGRVQLGPRVRVGAGAVIGRAGFGFAQGPDGRATRVPHLAGVVVGADAEIGALCTVDAGVLAPTRLAQGVKLDAHVHIGHNATIGAHTMIAAQSGLAGSVRVGARVRIGGQVGIADHVRVGDDARIAAKSGVIADVPAGRTVAGYPAVDRVRWLRGFASMLRRA